MKPFSMSVKHSRLVNRAIIAISGLLFASIPGASASTVESTRLMLKPPVPLRGGLGLYPVISSITRAEDMVTIEWFGLQGPFQVLRSEDAENGQWTRVGDSTFRNRLTIQISGDAGFFRVQSGRPVSDQPAGGTMNYIGEQTCFICHTETHDFWRQTPHARAFETLKLRNQHQNNTCLACKTVGHGTPLGFKDERSTRHLTGVQCESCHGPGGSHVANVRDRSILPPVTIASEVCGGCHNFHNPTYDQWRQSGHATMSPGLAPSLIQQGPARMLSCGPCHAGAVRTALLNQLVDPTTPLPNRTDAAHFPVTCVVCHEPHRLTANDAQLRNPLYSTANFSYSTSTNTTFAAQYRPEIQLCGQCHNMRGARWQDTSRPPHHSPQYNILIGQGAHDVGRPILGAHGMQIERQCVGCHNNPQTAVSGTTGYTHHSFEVHFDNCADCHRSASNAQRATERTQQRTREEIAELKAMLDTWATTRAPADLRARYGALAWEYNFPGDLSNSQADPTLRGPTPAEQNQIPDAIKQARLNIYLVQYDGSYGVHNAQYARHLLSVARTNISLELAAP
jgi:hypothetical protein